MYSKAVRTILITIASGLLVCLALVLIADPFYHYHKPIEGMEVYLYNTVYQSPGQAENFDYDTALLGSSMTENNRPSWYKKIGDKPVKIAYSGARSKDFELLLGRIFKKHDNLNRVIMDINEYQISVDPLSRFASNDEYLYDDNPFTDVNYIFNKDVLASSIGRVMAAMAKAPGNEEDAYTWDDPSLFGKDQVRKDYDLAVSNVNRAFSINEKSDADNEEIVTMVSENLENITHFFKEQPQTQFILYYPPYSVAYWQSLIETGEIDKSLLRYRAATQILLQYDNVKLYSFRMDKEVIENLDGYRDTCHFHPDVNRRIFEIINSEDETFLLTKENYIDRLSEFEDYIYNVDFDSFWE